MSNPEPLPPIQRFATLLKAEWTALDTRQQTELDTEDLLDIFWLAQYLPTAAPITSKAQQTESTVVVEQGAEVIAPPSHAAEPKAALYSQPPAEAESQSTRQSGLGAGLQLQVPAANALRSQLDLARALRPLMQKIPSPTQRVLDEDATVTQMAEQGVVSPVMTAAPERWFDLALVVEASPSLQIWADTISELQALVERQGAFRQIRTWRLGGDRTQLELSLNWQPTATSARSRKANALLDPTGRRMIWLVSDCTSEVWDSPFIYEWLAQWGKHSPIAIVQLFPERLWARTALGIGRPMRLEAGVAGATQADLSAKAKPLYPDLVEDSANLNSEAVGGKQLDAMTLPVISLEPEPVSRWAKVTMGVGDASVAGVKIHLNDLTLPVATNPAAALTPEQRVNQFYATASITAQKLAGLMAAVPVSIPVVHLIQQTLLPRSRQVHVAEVFMSGLLDAVVPTQPNQPTQYRFPAAVREKLIDTMPISKTTQVLDTVSEYISERLGLGTKTFTALIASLPGLNLEQKQTVEPFAKIALGTLRRLGGDYLTQADRLAPYLNPTPTIEATLGSPPLQAHRYQVAEVEVETLQRFDFETATIEQQERGLLRRRKWIITKFSGYGWQRVEDLGDGVPLELVEVIGGSFRMGSPGNEPGRYDDEGPQHEVHLNDFFIGKYPVTQAQWRFVAGLPPINRELEADLSGFKGDNRPVENVSWEEAMEFCARLSAKTGRMYALPTEAEWEYACRAGTTTPFYFGKTITTDLANYDGDYAYNNGPKGVNRGETTDVGSFPANAWGLYDMYGNVWEWCADHWHSDYHDKPKDLKKNGNMPWQTAETGSKRSLRGGSWIDNPRNCRSADRNNNEPGDRNNNTGFRVVTRSASTLL